MEQTRQCLLVDDDQDDQEVFLMTLEKIDKNIQFFTADNGVEALIMLEALTPDYIFLDVNMPKMNGIECLKGIREMDHLKHVKVFMYSTTSENQVMEKSKALGALDFIIKPTSAFSLQETLTKILR